MKEKGYSQRDRRIKEREINKSMQIQQEMADARAIAARAKEAEKEVDSTRRKTEIEVGGARSVVRRPAVIKGGKRPIGGVTASSSPSPRPDAGSNGSGGSVVKKPIGRRRPGQF